MKVKSWASYLVITSSQKHQYLPLGKVWWKNRETAYFLSTHHWQQQEKIQLHCKCCPEFVPAFWMEDFCNSQTPGPHSILREANDAVCCTYVTVFLGKPEQARRVATLFTGSFLHHAVFTRNPQQTTMAPPVYAVKPRNHHLWSSGPGAQHSAALLVHQLLQPLAPSCSACSGYSSPECGSLLFLLWFGKWAHLGKWNSVLFRALHAQKKKKKLPWTEGKNERRLKLLLPSTTTRISHLDHCRLVPLHSIGIKCKLLNWAYEDVLSGTCLPVPLEASVPPLWPLLSLLPTPAMPP